MFFFVVMERHGWTGFVSNSGKYLPKHVKYLKMFRELNGLKDSGWDMRTIKMVKVWMAVTRLKFWFAKIG
jgi:hypothetical protein